MTNPPKKKGTAHETRLVRHCLSLGVPAERRALKGSADEGDVWLFGGRLVVEVKARKARPCDEELHRMWQETNAEAARVPQADCAVLIVNRPGKASPQHWWAHLTTAEWAWLCGVDCDQVHPNIALDLVTVSVGTLLTAALSHPDLGADR